MGCVLLGLLISTLCKHRSDLTVDIIYTPIKICEVYGAYLRVYEVLSVFKLTKLQLFGKLNNILILSTNYTIGYLTRDLPACSTVSQPNAPPRDSGLK